MNEAASRLVPRLRPFTSTIFAEMTALATATGAINLGQGFPDADGPASMLAAAQRAIADGVNQYPPGPGHPDLLDAVAEHRRRYGLSYEPSSEVLVTTGATEGLTAALLAVVEAGDEVAVFEPYYDSYAAAVALAGATRRVVPLRQTADGRFAVDADAVRSAISPATKAIVINSPHNPTGTVFTRAELTELAAICVEHDLVAITDEVYEHLTFGAEHIPMATLPGMADRTITVSSAGKTFNCTGWKIGWVCGSADLVGAVRAAKQFMTFVSGAPFQPAVAHALRHERDWVNGLRDSLARKRNRLCDGLATAGFDVLRSDGTYFVCADVRPLGFTDATELAWRLPEAVGVAAVPVSAFADDGYDHLLRFAFCKSDDVLDAALARLQSLASNPHGR